MSKNIELLVDYNNSYLFFNPESLKISFEGELKDIAIGLFERYGKSLSFSNKTLNCISIGNSRLVIVNDDKNNQQLCYSYSEEIGSTNRPPLFLDLLKNEYIKVCARYNNIKSFW